MNNINLKSFTEGDYEMVCTWWEWWWRGETGIERELLPPNKNCLILEVDGEPLYAGFLFLGKEAPMGYLTWVVSNPFYKVKNRSELLEEFIKLVEQKAKQQDVAFMFTVCSNKTLMKAHENQGWWVDNDTPSYEGFKYI